MTTANTFGALSKFPSVSIDSDWRGVVCSRCKVPVANKLPNRNRGVRCTSCDVLHQSVLAERKSHALKLLAEVVTECRQRGQPYYLGREFSWRPRHTDRSNAYFVTTPSSRYVRWFDVHNVQRVWHPKQDCESHLSFDYLYYPKRQVMLGKLLAKRVMIVLLALRKRVPLLRALDRHIFIAIYRVWVPDPFELLC